MCVCVSFGKARTFTDLLRVRLCSEQTCIDYSSTHKGNNHRKVEGRRHLEDFKTKQNHKKKQKNKNKFTSVTFLNLELTLCHDVTILDHMANVRRESVLNDLSYV